ncbi:MAG: HAMP domain-containing sensor histidine kinase, partial [Verrucomicrobiota bacterium]
VEFASAYQGQLKQLADRYSFTNADPSTQELKELTEKVFGEDLEIRVAADKDVETSSEFEKDPLTSFAYEIPEGSAAGWVVSLNHIPEFTDHREEQRSETLFHGIGIVLGVSLVAGVVWFAVNRRLTMDELRTDLVTTVSHELKTPVAASRVLLETLCEGRTDAKTTREYISLLERENERMGELADQFLTFARLDSGQFEIERTDCHIAPLIEEQVTLVQPRFEARGGQLTIQKLDPDLEVKTDPAAVKVILANLVGNALKYGGSPPEGKVESGVTEHGFWISVSDKGKGIAPDSGERIFREFDRGDRKLSSESSGIGLGLAISQRFATLLGGGIHLSDSTAPGWQTRFSLIVPLT